MKTILGPAGIGTAYDQGRGHDVSATVATGSTTPIQFIYAVHDCLPPTLHMVSGNVAKFAIQVLASNSYSPHADAMQDETQAARAGNWQDVTSAYLDYKAATKSVVSSTAAAFTTKIIAPDTSTGVGFRPAYIKVVLTPDGTSGSGDTLDIYSHATSH